MKQLLILMASLLIGSALVGCSNDGHSTDYKVTCSLDGVMRHDSATLLVYEQDYDKLRVCATAHAASDGGFTFEGQTSEPHVALIRWDNDSLNPFYFILEPGLTTINITSHSWDISGGALNARYQHYANQRNEIMNQRVATWQQYLKMAADKTLKRDDEQRLVQQDSLLNDSLQRITVDHINRGDAVGRIIRERFADQLDQEHMRLLK